MFSRFREAINSAVSFDTSSSSSTNQSSDRPSVHRSQSSHHHPFNSNSSSSSSTNQKCVKFPYQRPAFLHLSTEDEVQVTADHSMRPIIVPRPGSGDLPWNAGYAECINAGKSARNEDQASFFRSVLDTPLNEEDSVLQSKVADLMSPLAALGLSTPKSLPFNSSSFLKSKSMNFEPPSTLDSNCDPKSRGRTTIQEAEEEEEFPALEAFSSSSSSDQKPKSEGLKIEEAVGNQEGKEEEESEGNVSSRTIPWTFFGLFDGHAGPGVAVAAAAQLHAILGAKLEAISDLLLHFYDQQLIRESKEELFQEKFEEEKKERTFPLMNGNLASQVSVDSLVKGALEASFMEMDDLIERDKRVYRMSGGCTALGALFILGKVFVANAGDSRAILVSRKKSCSKETEKKEESKECKDDWHVEPLSTDFAPESEADRVKMLAKTRPELLGSSFTRLEWVRRPTRRDLGSNLLVKDAGMSGWTFRCVTPGDLARFPLVYGTGKRSRVLGTIGVTRGFGDHELRAQGSDVFIKPFLSPQPAIQVLDVLRASSSSSSYDQDNQEEDCRVLVMGTDGLWDVTTNERVAAIVAGATFLDTKNQSCSLLSRYRFITAAQDLVMASRGKLRLPSDHHSSSPFNGANSGGTNHVMNGGGPRGGGGWRTWDEKSATIDDISVFVIPLDEGFARDSWQWRQSRIQELLTKKRRRDL